MNNDRSELIRLRINKKNRLNTKAVSYRRPRPSSSIDQGISRVQSIKRQKELLVQITLEAGVKANRQAFESVGFVVGISENWVVKRYADGREEKLRRLKKKTRLVKLD